MKLKPVMWKRRSNICYEAYIGNLMVGSMVFDDKYFSTRPPKKVWYVEQTMTSDGYLHTVSDTLIDKEKAKKSLEKFVRSYIKNKYKEIQSYIETT